MKTLKIPKNFKFLPFGFGNLESGCIIGCVAMYGPSRSYSYAQRFYDLTGESRTDLIIREFDNEPTEEKAREILSRYGIDLERC